MHINSKTSVEAEIVLYVNMIWCELYVLKCIISVNLFDIFKSELGQPYQEDIRLVAGFLWAFYFFL